MNRKSLMQRLPKSQEPWPNITVKRTLTWALGSHVETKKRLPSPSCFEHPQNECLLTYLCSKIYSTSSRESRRGKSEILQRSSQSLHLMTLRAASCQQVAAQTAPAQYQ